MPTTKSRNYKQEYKQKSQSSKKGKLDRAERNRARASAKKKGKVKKGDGKDVGHKRALKNGGAKRDSNTKVQSQRSNRAAGGKSGSKRGKAKGGRKGMKSRWG